MAQFIDASTVVSLLPVSLNEQKPGLIPAQYKLPAVKDVLKSCEVLIVLRAKFPVYIDENRPSLIVPEPSDRVAEAICRDYKVSMSHYSPGIAEPGLFWLKGEYKRSDILNAEQLGDKIVARELAQAREMQLQWFKEIIADADDSWGRYHMRRAISSLQKEAARILGLEREWSIDSQVEEASYKCKFCLEVVDAEAIICKSCHGILNMARYEKEYVKASVK